ncbi:P27 family phage terminase small subunit [Desulfosporosinus nitroreducens]|uniref:P27 family phage terminase small subunit n=1 Tax=Desulfosporosinus nitroreducens TaxID=2018668 RepID=UPI00207D3815|nr:P27 family phage terminase small subunit [Desulfosporosinus nitroreducens]MCO1599763.1 P27 family phage terminase small subunit [Desulfosporosinus nitroreducens]
MAANAKTKKYLVSELFAEVKKDLLDQLDRNGTVGTYYTDLVGDYMDMWVTKCLLVDDIQRRGVTIKYDNGGGQKGLKKNDSIEQRIKINAQMLKLLAELGIKPAQSGGEDDEL